MNDTLKAIRSIERMTRPIVRLNKQIECITKLSRDTSTASLPASLQRNRSNGGVW